MLQVHIYESYIPSVLRMIHRYLRGGGDQSEAENEAATLETNREGGGADYSH